MRFIDSIYLCVCLCVCIESVANTYKYTAWPLLSNEIKSVQLKMCHEADKYNQQMQCIAFLCALIQNINIYIEKHRERHAYTLILYRSTVYCENYRAAASPRFSSNSSSLTLEWFEKSTLLYATSTRISCDLNKYDMHSSNALFFRPHNWRSRAHVCSAAVELPLHVLL